MISGSRERNSGYEKGFFNLTSSSILVGSDVVCALIFFDLYIFSQPTGHSLLRGVLVGTGLDGDDALGSHQLLLAVHGRWFTGRVLFLPEISSPLTFNVCVPSFVGLIR